MNGLVSNSVNGESPIHPEFLDSGGWLAQASFVCVGCGRNAAASLFTLARCHQANAASAPLHPMQTVQIPAAPAPLSRAGSARYTEL